MTGFAASSARRNCSNPGTFENYNLTCNLALAVPLTQKATTRSRGGQVVRGVDLADRTMAAFQ